MSRRYLLDTDTCIEILRGRGRPREILRTLSPDDLAVSAMTLAELHFGALRSHSPHVMARHTDAFLSAPIEVVPFDREAARHHAELRDHLRSTPVGDRDLVIGATALSGEFTVVTGNRRHFQRMPGVVVEDWIRDEEA